MWIQLQNANVFARGLAARVAVGVCAFALLVSGAALPLHTLLEHQHEAVDAHAAHGHVPHAHACHGHAHAADEGERREGVNPAPASPSHEDECLLCQQLLAGSFAVTTAHINAGASAVVALPTLADDAPHSAAALRLALGRAPPVA